MLSSRIESRLREAVLALIPDADPAGILVRPASEARLGDYQANVVMGLAKPRGLQPRALAADIVARLDVAEWCEAVEVAGPGFLNFRLSTSGIEDALQAALRAPVPFVEPAAPARTVVIDFSSPNVAKPMHIGHVRSTVLGDALARTLRLLGHRVITDNHIGDWGTQFGMLLVGWKSRLDRDALASDPIGELERLYKSVNAACEADPAVREQAKAELVRLQSGDADNLAIWREMIRLSQVQFDAIYGRLGVGFDHTLGESFYNPWLAEAVADMARRGIARDSEGAKAVFSRGEVAPKDDPFQVQRDGAWHDLPLLVQKSDGGFNYATTDLATLDYRVATWAPTDILYVTDGRQQGHFRQVFAAFRAWKPEAASRVRLHHVWFGSILGEDGKPFKTRSGDTVKLGEVLDEAEERALAVVREKRPELPEATQREIARVVGLGAIKYQDLLPNRQSDYVFSWDKMLALQGNTAPYLQYQYTRAAKLVRDGALQPDAAAVIRVGTAEERALARHLLNFGLVLAAVGEEARPNYLCNYLYELAGLSSRFYEACPVLRSEEPLRTSRLALCHLTARVLRTGLDCLGIAVSEQM